MDNGQHDYGQAYEGQRFARQQQMDRQPRNDFEALQSSGGGVGKYGVFGAISIILAIFDVAFLPVVSVLWVQDIVCIAAIGFGSASFICSRSKQAKWMALAGIIIAACALVGNMTTHGMYGVIFQAASSL